MAEFRIGQGFDIHRTDPSRKLFIGGVEIKSDFGLIGHSDADVLLHAVVDALLGATGKGDIGKLFPDTDIQNKDRKSTDFLIEAYRLIKNDSWSVVNLDCTILAEAPKILPYASVISESIGSILECSPSLISIKATTMERLGSIGKGEGIAAMAVVLLTRE